MELNKEIGKIGEEIAAQYFRQRGYEVELNQRIGSLEIDLIISKTLEIRFIEVKTIHRNFNGYMGIERISRQKIRNLKRAVLKYSLILAIKQDIFHIDAMVIYCDVSKKMANIKYYLDIVA